MFKKIGLSAAAICAALALVQAPAAMAADRDDFHGGNSYRRGDDGYRYDNNYRHSDRGGRDFRNYQGYGDSGYRVYRDRDDYRPEWREQHVRRTWDRDHDGDRR